MTKMMPIGPLMIEHRLIERVIASMRVDIQRFERFGVAEPVLVDRYANFIRMYADRCHHGKEEDILFRELRGKSLTPALSSILEELLEDHALGRRLTGQLVDANQRYAAGDTNALAEILDPMRTLVEFYPRHIEKEDKHFFIPVMDCFSAHEQEAMLQEGFALDRGLIHQLYREFADALEERAI